MALSFIQWEKYIQSFPDDRLLAEFNDPGSTVAGPEKPPQGAIVAAMGERNAAREADDAMAGKLNQPNGTIAEQEAGKFAGSFADGAEQTFGEFSEERRPVAGPGGGFPPVPASNPPMRAYGGPIPGYQYGGSIPGYQTGGDTEERGLLRGIASMLTGADSFQDAAENPYRTAARTGVSLASINPAFRVASGLGKFGMGLMGLGKGSKLLSAIGRGTLGLGSKDAAGRATTGFGSSLARKLAGKRRISRIGNPRRRYERGTPRGVAKKADLETRWPKGSVHPEGSVYPPGARYPMNYRVKALRGKSIPPNTSRAGTSRAGQAKPFVDRAKVRSPLLDEQAIGRAAVLRGGGLGVAGLLALDPFDGPETPEQRVANGVINKDLADTSAIRTDRSKGFAGGAYDWLDEETTTEKAIRELMDYREEGIASGEFTEETQDRLSREFIKRMNRRLPDYDSGRQGYADTIELASGGITSLGYHDGGGIAHEHDEDGRPHAEGYRSVWDWKGDLATPEGDYSTGERSLKGDFGRSIRRGKANVHGAIQALSSGLGNVYEAFGEGQAFGPELRNADGRLLRLGADGELYDPDVSGSSGQKEWRLEPIEEPSIEGPLGKTMGSIGADEILGGMANLEMENTDPAPTLDSLAARAGERVVDAADAADTWMRMKNPEEQAAEDYFNERAATADSDANNVFTQGLAEAIASPGEGGMYYANMIDSIGDATEAQRQERDKADDFEGFNIDANVERSRRNMHPAMIAARDNIYRALASRGEVDSTIEGRIRETQARLSQGQGIGASDVEDMRQLLGFAVERGPENGGMTEETASAILENYEAQFFAQQAGGSLGS
jgi:hypothetical protein|tara:strand:- start:319 stop:2841 length:2523 start_codon:yes stop_codon:yes gene_type:complete